MEKDYTYVQRLQDVRFYEPTFLYIIKKLIFSSCSMIQHLNIIVMFHALSYSFQQKYVF